MKKELLVSITLCALLSSPCQATQQPPKDEATTDATLVTFRQHLLRAVKHKDLPFIISILDPNVQYGLGAGSGKTEFMRNWNLSAKQSDFWTKFNLAVERGGVFYTEDGKREFTAPYADFDKVAGSENEMAVVVNSCEPLREQPNETAKVLTTLHYDMVELPGAGDQKPSAWTKVKVGDKQGYVASIDLIKQTDPFAKFRKIHGKWYLTWFGTASL
jgi:hypothetical protein